MKRSAPAALLLAFLSIQGVFGQTVPPSVSLKAPLQASVLISARDILDPAGNILSSWTSGSACSSWTRVTCDDSNNVVAIELTYAKLNGTLPSVLGSIPTLTTLNLTGNWLSGPIPASFGNLINLRVLDLSRNVLNDSLPASLGNLTSLQVLDTYTNVLTGAIPSSYALLTSLTELNVAENGLNGTVPDIFSGMTALQTLSLYDNKLSGELPASLYALPAIQSLNVAGNQLTGAIAPSLADLTSLKDLNMSFNEFSGSIPPALAAATSPLLSLDLSYNQLTGSIPAWSPNNLTLLHLSSNQLTGHLIPAFATPPPNLANLQLDHNALQGPIPVEFGTLTKLTTLVMSNNVLSGNLPENLNQCVNLTLLDLSNNLLSGPFPPSYTQFTNLQQMLLNSNSLTGALNNYDFTNATLLVKLSLNSNQFTGGLPPNIPKVCLTLDLGNNNLDGTIDGTMFEDHPVFTTVILGDNQLSGAIPYQLWNSSTFQYVALNNNSFTEVPSTPVSKFVTDGLGYILLGGNPVCSNPSVFPGSSNPSSLCDIPSTVGTGLGWEPTATTTDFPTKCYNKDETPNCLGKEYPSVPYYAATGGKCLCAQPLVVTILLDYCPFLVYAENFDLLSIKLRTKTTEILVASGINLDIKQVWIIGASQLNQRGAQLITYHFYGAANESNANPLLDKSIASSIVTSFQTNRFALGKNWGPSTFVSSYLTEPGVETAGSGGSGSSLPGWAIAVIVLGCMALLLAVAALVWGFCLRREPADKRTKFDREIEQFFVRHISLEELIAATNDFDPMNVLGEGGFGLVYRGQAEDGTLWAVKRAKNSTKVGALEDFQKEVRAISRMSHKNIVKLLGYCDDNDEQILVYEFCQNGALKSYMQAKDKGARPPLTFEQRLDIAIGAAEGLRYMHSFAEPAIIHRDIKSDNILLDYGLESKVADFGLLKDLPKGGGELDDREMSVAGTPGYVDPEYFLTFRVTPKSDVYSYGVVLLELITGKPPVLEDPNSAENMKVGLASWASPYMRLNQLDTIVDPTLKGKCPVDGLEQMVKIACDCVERLSLNRPDMTEVANRLGSIKAKATMSSREEKSIRLSPTSSVASDRLPLFGDWSYSQSISMSTMDSPAIHDGEIGVQGTRYGTLPSVAGGR